MPLTAVASQSIIRAGGTQSVSSTGFPVSPTPSSPQPHSPKRLILPPIAGATGSKAGRAGSPGSQTGPTGGGGGATAGVAAGRKSSVESVGSDNSELYQDPVELPPWHPAAGIILPKLHPLYQPQTAEERLHFNPEKGLLRFSFRAYTEGPFDMSSWVIPKRLMMGAVPLGRAKKRLPMSAIHAIMFSGIDTFVSLMEEDEEADFFRQKGLDSMPHQLKAAFASAKFANDTVIHDNSDLVMEVIGIIKKIPVFLKADVRYEEAHQALTRAKARLRQAKEAVQKAKTELKLLPTRFDWLRIPLKSDSVPNINALVPQLWELEKRLARGENLYVYSNDGHGRVGLICGCLMGRLYGEFLGNFCKVLLIIECNFISAVKLLMVCSIERIY